METWTRYQTLWITLYIGPILELHRNVVFFSVFMHMPRPAGGLPPNHSIELQIRIGDDSYRAVHVVSSLADASADIAECRLACSASLLASLLMSLAWAALFLLPMATNRGPRAMRTLQTPPISAIQFATSWAVGSSVAAIIQARAVRVISP